MIARRVVFFGLLAAAAARLMYTGEQIYMFIVLVMVAVLFIGIFNIFMTVGILRMRQLLQSDMCERGETTALKIRVTCPRFFQPAYIIVHYRDIEDILNGRSRTAGLSFSGGYANEMSLPVFCKYCGIYDVGIHKLEILDLFGLIRLRLPKSVLLRSDVAPLTVLPAVGTIPEVTFEQDFDDSETLVRSWSDDLSSIAQVRDWHAGDSLKRIHWKLSARFGSVQTKEFDKVSSQSVTVYADFSEHGLENEPAAELEDRLICVVTAFCQTALRQGVTLRLVGHGLEEIRLENIMPDDFRQLRLLLAGVRFGGTHELADIIAEDQQKSDTAGVSAVITSSPSDKLAGLLLTDEETHPRTFVCIAARTPFKIGDGSPEASFLEALRSRDVPCAVIHGNRVRESEAADE